MTLYQLYMTTLGFLLGTLLIWLIKRLVKRWWAALQTHTPEPPLPEGMVPGVTINEEHVTPAEYAEWERAQKERDRRRAAQCEAWRLREKYAKKRFPFLRHLPRP